MQKFLSINLAKKRGNFLEKFIDWALNVGRVVIIITEGIAISAFLYRFSLDDTLVHFHDLINSDQQIVSSPNFKQQEYIFRNLQNRLSLTDSFSNETNKTTIHITEIFQDITSFIPQGLLISDFSVSPQTIKMTASAASVNSISIFLNKLKDYKQIENISLDSIQNNTSTANIVVSITAVLKS